MPGAHYDCNTQHNRHYQDTTPTLSKKAAAGCAYTQREGFCAAGFPEHPKSVCSPILHGHFNTTF